uniref:DNA-damage-repair/toleration protein DRT100 family n=1 Tax=Cajanus cajan TaxID=3821 RepID=A0A151TQY4_CAJCA|nr:DNA-damage-repair/toleration protein DRT100 family [Cajanus cajan]
MSISLKEVRCNEKDQQTLLIFKKGVLDPYNELGTWSSEKDCCAWKGVQCDNTISRIARVSLSGKFLEGEINLSLLELEFLNHLDLSFNEFNVISFPPINKDVISSSNLHYLDLSWNNGLFMDNLHWIFEGCIPPKLFNLSSLIHMDLPHNELSGSIPHVSKTYYAFKYVYDDIINLFSKGQVYEYNLDWDRRTIDLSANNLSGEIPLELFGLIQVQTMNLSYNHLTGTTPKKIGGMKNLESLDLSKNKLFEEIPLWSFCGSLLLVQKWRHRYYHQFLDLVSDQLYVSYIWSNSTIFITKKHLLVEVSETNFIILVSIIIYKTHKKKKSKGEHK